MAEVDLCSWQVQLLIVSNSYQEAKLRDNGKQVNYTGVHNPQLDIGYITCTIPFMRITKVWTIL